VNIDLTGARKEMCTKQLPAALRDCYFAELGWVYQFETACVKSSGLLLSSAA